MNDKNLKLQEFWNQVFLMDENAKNEIKNSVKEDDWLNLSPSDKLTEALKYLKDCENVLDYGCGNGWASIVAVKQGAKHVTAVDTSKNGIDALQFFANLFGLNNSLNAFPIDFDWLSNQKQDQYDGLVCSNVLDVVDEDTSNAIIKDLNKVLKEGSKIIIGLNYYISAERAKEKGIVFENGNELYVNGVLRLLNKSDEEWIKAFEKYFKLVKIDYFAWSGEEKETRRLFYLQK